jgi:predicted nucleotide-binding protein
VKDLKENITSKVNNLTKIIDKVDLLKSEAETFVTKVSATAGDTRYDSNKVFVVHGHNAELQQIVARTLERLDLTPIILHEQANEGKTLIEKFEKHSEVGFAIVLLTDDDEGKSKLEGELKKRARQNVILELGYFIGKLGRKKVVPLYSEGVELPTDIHGLLYVPLDKEGIWKFALVRELKAAGFDVDANRIM